jgi:carbon storage regulator
MLVLSRKIGEKIVISNDIVVTVVKVEGNKVRLGIEAPDQIRIMRSELMWWRDKSVEEETESPIQPALCAAGGRSGT